MYVTIIREGFEVEKKRPLPTSVEKYNLIFYASDMILRNFVNVKCIFPLKNVPNLIFECMALL